MAELPTACTDQLTSRNHPFREPFSLEGVVGAHRVCAGEPIGNSRLRYAHGGGGLRLVAEGPHKTVNWRAAWFLGCCIGLRSLGLKNKFTYCLLISKLICKDIRPLIDSAS